MNCQNEQRVLSHSGDRSQSESKAQDRQTQALEEDEIAMYERRDLVSVKPVKDTSKEHQDGVVCDDGVCPCVITPVITPPVITPVITPVVLTRLTRQTRRKWDKVLLHMREFLAPAAAA